MKIFSARGREYDIDAIGFLLDPNQWDENFAESMASSMGMSGKLNGKQWEVVQFIRETVKRTGKCPLIYQTCRENGLSLTELKGFFPTGYLRGACKLAGLTYREAYLGYLWPESKEVGNRGSLEDKTYQIDVYGFLLDHENWDEQYASFRAVDLKVPGGLGDKHWAVIHFLRKYYTSNHTVPTVYETCEGVRIDIDELERLFPDGYHRGAVKLAGLRVR